MVTWVSFIFLLIVCCRGLGMVEVYELTISAYIAFYTSIYIGERKWWKSISFLLFFILSLCIPSVFILWGMIAIVLFFVDRKLSLIPLFFWFLEDMEIMPLTYNAIIIEYLLLAIIIRNIPKNISNYICLGIIHLIIVFEVFTSIYLGQETFIEYKNYNVYGQGETFQRISGCSLSRNSHHYNRTIRNRSYGTSVPDSVPGIVIYDIDLQKKDKFAVPIRLQQQTPWNSQMYLGNQYVLESIRSDGALYSNIGIMLNNNTESKTLLARPMSFYNSLPLIAKYKKTLYLNDSDYFSSYLANYQKCLIKELVGGRNIRPFAIRFVNFLCLLLISLLSVYSKLTDKKSRMIQIIWGIVSLLCISAIYADRQEGEIRMVGNMLNSHENNGFDGVPKAINASGYPYVVGNQKNKILVVKSGKQAQWKGESIIVAESKAIIHFENRTIKIGESPLGITNGIIDSRSINIDGNEKGSLYRIKGVTIIGTDSPAKIQWKRFLK